MNDAFNRNATAAERALEWELRNEFLHRGSRLTLARWVAEVAGRTPPAPPRSYLFWGIE